MSEENHEKQEKLSFTQKVDLLKDVFLAADERNNYPSTLPGSPSFDTFAESYANLPEYRVEYERLSGIFVRLRQNIEETISDKKEFADQLEEAGELELAQKFRTMFMFD